MSTVRFLPLFLPFPLSSLTASFLPQNLTPFVQHTKQMFVVDQLSYSISANLILKQLRPHPLPSFFSLQRPSTFAALSIPTNSSTALERPSHDRLRSNQTTLPSCDGNQGPGNSLALVSFRQCHFTQSQRRTYVFLAIPALSSLLSTSRTAIEERYLLPLVSGPPAFVATLLSTRSESYFRIRPERSSRA
jgi:hypothetical protein